MAKELLLVDDSDADQAIIRQRLMTISDDVQVTVAASGAEAIEELRRKSYDCVFLDNYLPDMTGIEMLETVCCPETRLSLSPVVMLTGAADVNTVARAIGSGAQDYIIKGNISKETLEIAMIKAIQHFTLRQRVANDQQELKKKIEAKKNKYAEQTRLLNTILDNLPLAIFAKDPNNDYKLALVNKYSAELLCSTREDLVGKSDFEYFPVEDAIIYNKSDRKVMGSGETLQYVGQVQTPKGEITAHTIKVPLYGDNNEPQILLGILEDITDDTKLKTELEYARTKAELASKAKDLFLANMSHELRTPLNSIIGLINLLRQEEHLDAEQMDMLDIVHRSSKSLLSIVNDILDISKIEANKIELENRVFNLSSMINGVLEKLRPLASEKSLDLKNMMDSIKNLSVLGDEHRLSRIILNLGSNAIKYSERGAIEVTSSMERLGNNRIAFICQVKDNGIGIPENKIDLIFEKFTQAEESTERRFGGTGLGLYITKQLTELMGGNISVKSVEGMGSEFTVCIPLNVVYDEGIVFEESDSGSEDNANNAYQQPNETAKKPISEARILVSEDHEFNQVFILKLLKKIGCEHVTLVTNGADAVQKFACEDFDIILMDCHMPVKNGYEATRQIRDLEQTNKKTDSIPIIAITADAMVGTREICLEAGMSEYITKPVDQADFINLLSRWFQFADTNNKVPKIPYPDSNDPISLELLDQYADGNQENLNDMISAFLKKTADDLEKLKNEITDGENQQWSAIAHGFKGSSSYVGAKNLKNLCAEAQALLHASAQDREHLFQKIEKEYGQICAFIQQEQLKYKEKSK